MLGTWNCQFPRCFKEGAQFTLSYPHPLMLDNIAQVLIRETDEHARVVNVR